MPGLTVGSGSRDMARLGDDHRLAEKRAARSYFSRKVAGKIAHAAVELFVITSAGPRAEDPTKFGHGPNRGNRRHITFRRQGFQTLSALRREAAALDHEMAKRRPGSRARRGRGPTGNGPVGIFHLVAQAHEGRGPSKNHRFSAPQIVEILCELAAQDFLEQTVAHSRQFGALVKGSTVTDHIRPRARALVEPRRNSRNQVACQNTNMWLDGGLIIAGKGRHWGRRLPKATMSRLERHGRRRKGVAGSVIGANITMKAKQAEGVASTGVPGATGRGRHGFTFANRSFGEACRLRYDCNPGGQV